MRIWSIHPAYLDTKGLVAVWRETLLAKHVLEGKTKGYTNHPQLTRFKATAQPTGAIQVYLQHVYSESVLRGYHFDPGKFDPLKKHAQLKVTRGQVLYEWEHLLSKLRLRDRERYQQVKHLVKIELHPLFREVKGDIEDWEKFEDYQSSRS